MVSGRYDLADKNDLTVGSGTKADARRRKLFTRSVHIILRNNRGEVMVCRRSSTKRSYANQITSSAGGHVERGEDYYGAAKRELLEELGIRAKIRDIGRFDVVNKRERAIHHLFVGTMKKMESRPNHEVSSMFFIDPRELRADITKHPRRYAAPFHGAFRLYLARAKN